MKSSESIKNLCEALVKAQDSMGGAVKSSSNPFFKSSYADLTSVIKAIKQPFSDNGISYTQFPVNSDSGVGVVTRLMHVSGEWLEEEYTLPIVKRDPQSAGSAITYARRYALQSIAGIPTADDDAESAMLRGGQDEKINESSVLEIAELIHSTSSDEQKFCELFGVNNLSAIKVSQYERAITMLKAKKARQ
tara:strand:- start:12689 stop:13261 length:573 start_codon:yes stop_codon:yes gene_type:complete